MASRRPFQAAIMRAAYVSWLSCLAATGHHCQQQDQHKQSNKWQPSTPAPCSAKSSAPGQPQHAASQCKPWHCLLRHACTHSMLQILACTAPALCRSWHSVIRKAGPNSMLLPVQGPSLGDEE